MSDKEYIVIKGFEWLYERLDDIGYTASKRELMKLIWLNKPVNRDLLKQIVGDKK